MDYVSVVIACLTLLEKLMPEVRRLFASGELTVEQQAELQARYTKIRDDADAFSGPEWKSSTTV